MNRDADARAFEDLEDYRARLEERVAERTAALQSEVQERELAQAAFDSKLDATFFCAG